MGFLQNIFNLGVHIPRVENYQLDIEGSGLEKGMYYYRLEIGDDIHSGKIIRAE